MKKIQKKTKINNLAQNEDILVCKVQTMENLFPTFFSRPVGLPVHQFSARNIKNFGFFISNIHFSDTLNVYVLETINQKG